MEQKKDKYPYSKTNKETTSYGQWEGNDSIPEEQYFSFIISRTEKLSAAVYMVTNLITDNEPAKYTIRQKSLELLSYVAGARTYPVSERLEGVTKTADAITEIVSLLHIARAGNLISEMNYTVLADEYTHLQSFIADIAHIHTDTDDFLESLFADAYEGQRAPVVKDTSKGHKEYENVLYNLTRQPQQSGRSKDIPQKKTPEAEQKTKPIQNRAAVEELKQKRQQVILDLVKRHGEVSIKDVAAHITDCSEKTVQRELLALVKDKKLIKEGEKRWSKYRLKTTS